MKSDLSIPDFLKATGTIEERQKAFDDELARQGKTLLPSTKTMDVEGRRKTDPAIVARLEQQRRDDIARLKTRLVKAKARRAIDPAQHVWDSRRGGYYWKGTRERVTFRSDGSVVPRGAIAPDKEPASGDVGQEPGANQVAVKEMLAELNGLLSIRGAAQLKQWKGSTADLQKRLDKERSARDESRAKVDAERPPKTFGDPAVVAAVAAAAVAPPKVDDAATGKKNGRGRLWCNTPASTRPTECKAIRPNTKRHRALVMMEEGRHTVAAISADIGANAIAHAFCLKRDSGIGYEFLDPRTLQRLSGPVDEDGEGPCGNVDAVIRAVWPTGLDLSNMVLPETKRAA